jgi:NodT family efflux transporter outer membrane factor (OMF) lipoprotein
MSRRLTMRRIRWRTWAVLAAASLAGCNLGPDYARPTTDQPGAWRESEVDAAAAWPAADWWRGFNSPELDTLITQAQQANPDLGAAVARIREADAQARIAGAALLPTVEAGVNPSTQQVLSPFSAQPVHYTSYAATLTASYEIDFWGKNKAALAAAKATALSSNYDRTVVALSVVTGVASSYFQALALRDRLQVARENLANAEAVLGIITNGRRAGGASDLELAQQETVVAGLRAVIPPLQQQLSQTVDALAILLGRPPEAVAISASSLGTLATPMVAPGLPSELLARRPDVHEAEAQLIAANANIKVARAQFFPSITLTAQGGVESLAMASFMSPASAIYTIAGSLVQPIFEGGRLKGQLEFSKARYEELLQAYRKAVISAFSNVEDALAMTQRTAEQETEQANAVAKARRAFEISQAQFKVGTVDLLTVLNTQTALFTNNDQLLQVKLAHLQALVALFNALGGGWRE